MKKYIILQTILINHSALLPLNLPHTSDFLKTMYLGYSETYKFEHDGVFHQVHMQVNQYHDDVRYCITYYENGKLRNHNISYIKKLYREACAYEGVTPLDIIPSKPLTNKRIASRKRKTIETLTRAIEIHKRMNIDELIITPTTYEEQITLCKDNSLLSNFYYGGHRYHINQHTTCGRWKVYYQVHCYEDGQEIPMDLFSLEQMLLNLQNE